MGIAYEDFLSAIRDRESNDNYSLVNSYGYLGAYQFGEAALVELGFVRADGNLYNNDFSGGWTGQNGVDSRAEFLNTPAAQDAAADLWWPVLWRYLQHYGADDYLGQTIGGVQVTASGLIAGAHLLGADAVAQWLDSNGRATLTDAYGTSISEYIGRFGGYVMPFDTGERDLSVLADTLDGYSDAEQSRVATIFFLGADVTIGDAWAGDSLAGSGNRDVIDGSGGNDLLDGRLGGDALIGGDDRDNVNAGGGRDVVLGGNGNDRLAGNAGNDWISAGRGNDKVVGGFGDDTMRGGGGADNFVFRNGNGDDKVLGFSVDAGDRIDLSGVAGITGFRDLMNNHASLHNGDVVIDYGAGNSITLVDVRLSDLSANDFLF